MMAVQVQTGLVINMDHASIWSVFVTVAGKGMIVIHQNVQRIVMVCNHPEYKATSLK